jgi:2-deoxy-D-gluconate 3-dehydrogenase
VTGYVKRFSVAGKRALVTGGAHGMGPEQAKVLAEAGADLAIVDIDRVGMQETKLAIERVGRECLMIEADLSTAEGPRQAGQAALEHFGAVDILVNNAGITSVQNLVEASVEDWDAILAVNLRAPFILARTVAPKMMEQRSGKIVNISSNAGVMALEGHGAYCASKGGLNTLTKVMALEWGPHNIQSNAIAPTVILTPMGQKVWLDNPEKSKPVLARIPLHRFGQPVEVADLVLYLASPASDLINGAVVVIDGGQSSV